LELISNFLLYAASTLLMLTLVVFIHEFGHFIVARWCGVRVQTFSIGFGREIFGFYDRHGTRWCFARWPLGGYVRFVDDENAASAPSREALEKMDAAARSEAFQTKPLWQRAAVVIAGPLFNIVSAVLIVALGASLLGTRDMPPLVDRVEAGSVAARAGLQPGDRITAVSGLPIEWTSDLNKLIVSSRGVPLEVEFERNGRRQTVQITPDSLEVPALLGTRVAIGDIGLRPDPATRIGEVRPGSPASKAGLRPGDRIKAIEGNPVDRFSGLTAIVHKSADKPLAFTIERDGKDERITITPRPETIRDAKGVERTIGLIGIGPERGALRRHSPVHAIRYGIVETASLCTQVVQGLGELPAAIAKVFTFQSQNAIGGPGAIVEMTGHAAKGGITDFVRWLAIFSVMLGVMNLLPIPLLDGGHLMFYAYEAIRGKPLGDRAQEIGFKIGIAVIATLMTAAFLGDATRYIGRLIGLG